MYTNLVLPCDKKNTMSEKIASLKRWSAECSSCEVYLTQMQQTIHLMGKLSEESLAPEVKQQLQEAFRDWKRT